jgi:hypothetical protein
MKSIANKSSFGARAMSGAYLLLTRPHVAAPGVSGNQRKQR